MVSMFRIDIFRGIICSHAMFGYRDMLWPTKSNMATVRHLGLWIPRLKFQILKIWDLIYPNAKKEKKNRH